MYLKGNTALQITRYLNSEKIKSPSKYLKMKNASNKWIAGSVNDMLSNPFYYGSTVTNKYSTNYITKTCKKNKNRDSWIIKENTHKGIISKEKYNIVQEIKKASIKKGIKYDYLLRNLVYCGHCKLRNQYKLYKSADKKEIYMKVQDLFMALYIENQKNVKTKRLSEKKL